MRSGSTWLCDLLASLLRCNWAFLERGNTIKPQRFRQLIKSSHNKVYKMHWTHPNTICGVIRPNDKQNYVMSITRDVKDIAISMIMYTRYDPIVSKSPRLKPILDARNKTRAKHLNDKDYINYFIKTSSYFPSIINSWKSYNDGYTHPNYMLINYEDLINKPMPTFKEVTNFLSFNTPARQLRKIIDQNSFKTKTKRNPGQGNNRAFRRIGIVGDYKKYLNQESLNIIDRLLNDG